VDSGRPLLIDQSEGPPLTLIAERDPGAAGSSPTALSIPSLPGLSAKLRHRSSDERTLGGMVRGRVRVPFLIALIVLSVVLALTVGHGFFVVTAGSAVVLVEMCWRERPRAPR
jgi:hypothetical protein